MKKFLVAALILAVGAFALPTTSFGYTYTGGGSTYDCGTPSGDFPMTFAGCRPGYYYEDWEDADDSLGPDEVGECLECPSGYTCAGGFAGPQAGGAQPGCASNQISVNGTCQTAHFSVTTTNDTDVFGFYLSAAGTFYIDWGDGTIETINRTNNTNYTKYTHSYDSEDEYTVRFGGAATGYNTSTDTAAISFYNGGAATIASIAGNLATMFPYISGNPADGAQPRFRNTFNGATNLTAIPATLFSGYTTGASYMFRETFRGCTSLTTIPTGLFSGITTGAQYMFYSTFRGCTSLTTIPTGLFSGITTGASYMFVATFMDCTSLTTIPTGLFSGITTGASYMFSSTFKGCTSLTTIPTGLFSGITTGAERMFQQTFYGCTKLTTIPSNLFSGITTGATFMFFGTFGSCTRLSGYIPPTTFAGLIANNHPTATSMWADTFANTAVSTSCPSTMTQYITGYEGTGGATDWGGKVSCGYGVTYSCNGGTGTAPSGPSNALYSGQSYTPATNTCTKSGSIFVGWAVSGTNDVVAPGTSFTWNYDANKTMTAQWQTEKFSVTTTGDTQDFGFYLSAAGTFYIDWGDGTVETITRTNNTDYTKYEHEYASAGAYVVQFGGTATGYNTNEQTPTITFNEAYACWDDVNDCESNWSPSIASISGSLSALFPMFGTGDGRHPGFYATFAEAEELTTIPSTLFSGITTGANYMFSGTFNGCTSLTTIPDGLFSGITTGADYMFYYTFGACTSLTTIPAGLFSGITTGADSMFRATFYGCTKLTTIPTGLFSGITTGARSMFTQTFYNCTNLSGYIPPTTFAGLIANNHPTATNMWKDTFTNTAVSTSCPSTMTQYITGYEGTGGTTDWGGKVSCTCAPGTYANGTTCAACANTKPANSSWTVGATTSTCAWTCDSGYISNGTSCDAPTFSVTTTSGTTEFGFYLSAAGTFYIDWGDGTIETINRTNNTNYTKYEHHYSEGDEYTVQFGGAATGYNTNLDIPTITFNEEAACYDECDGNWAPNISSISGNLATLFPYISGNAANGAQPRFVDTFGGAENLTAIPATLFSGYSTGASSMFFGTFSGCTSLTTIPSGLFSGITTGAQYMFSYTFQGCTALTTIPLGLFSGITTGASYMFSGTFQGCTKLTTIPTGLFSNNITNTSNATYMFSQTFYGCTALTTIPTGLFGGITTGASYMFSGTFQGCTKLTTIPTGLFSGITTGAQYMFSYTFQGCTALTTIPTGLFSGITTGAQRMFSSTFSGCTALTTIPTGLFNNNITNTANATYMFSSTFSGCTSLTTIPLGLFSGITTGASYMFSGTFQGCTKLTTIPTGLFSNNITNTSNATYMFSQTFYGCTALTTIPTGLFGGITTGASYMFSGTFQGCTKLTTIPTGLFSNNITNTSNATYMFSQTFSGCTKLTTIPTGLFSGITSGATYMFYQTFYGCTSLTTIPTGLFSGITTGAQRMFYSTFQGCTSLTTIPTGLFSGITTGATYMFYRTFYGCTALTTIPTGLFSGITTGAGGMFYQTFYGCTNLSGYIPPTTFAGLIAANHPTASLMWSGTFTNTAVSESCPSTMTQYITGYEGSGSTTWNGKVSCAENCPANNTTLRTSTGLIFPLYGEKLTTPALNIKFENDQICYAELRPGTASDTLNFSVPGGATYHAVPTTAN